VNIFNSTLRTTSGEEKLFAQRINELVKKKSSTGLGGFVDLNNDLGFMIEELPSYEPGLLMPYFYARRWATSGMFSQGAIDKKTFDYVDSLFFNYMAQVGSKITKNEQIRFQEDSLDRSLELISEYFGGVTKKNSALLVVAAKQGISIRDALLSALGYDHHNLENIVCPVMCTDWIMQPKFCMGFIATGVWELSDNFDVTSKKVLIYFNSIPHRKIKDQYDLFDIDRMDQTTKDPSSTGCNSLPETNSQALSENRTNTIKETEMGDVTEDHSYFDSPFEMSNHLNIEGQDIYTNEDENHFYDEEDSREYNKITTFNEIISNETDFLDALISMNFSRYTPRSSSWTDVYIYNDNEDALYILIGKSNIAYKYFNEHVSLDFDSHNRLSTAGGSSVKRLYFSSNPEEVWVEIIQMAETFIQDKNTFKFCYLQKGFIRKSYQLVDCFDAIIFDLDNTLIASDRLKVFRGRKNLNLSKYSLETNLVEKLKRCHLFIDQDFIVNIIKEFPSMKLGILTRAPRAYTNCILEEKYPNVNWDCVFSYEDLNGNVKPSPYGLYKIADLFQINDLRKILLVGDETTDIISSYQAGGTSVLFTACWERNKTKANWDSEQLIPDGIVNNKEQLFDFIANPYGHKPALESLSMQEKISTVNVRIVYRWDRFLKRSQKIYVFGRYFTKSSGKYNFEISAINHKLTADILSFKNGIRIDYFSECFANYLIETWCKKRVENIYISPIPKKQMGSCHMENFIDALSEKMSNYPNLSFKKDLLYFKPNAKSNKNLSAEERSKNIRENLMITNKTLINNKTIIIIDDILTTGATMQYASYYLQQAGATVFCLALANSISGVSHGI